MAAGEAECQGPWASCFPRLPNRETLVCWKIAWSGQVTVHYIYPYPPLTECFYSLCPPSQMPDTCNPLPPFCLCSDKFTDSSSLDIKGMHLVLRPSNRLLEVTTLSIDWDFLIDLRGLVHRFVFSSKILDLSRRHNCHFTTKSLSDSIVKTNTNTNLHNYT